MATVPQKQMPFDIRFVYLTSGIYWGALATTVLVGPDLYISLILGLSACVVLPVIAWAGLWVLSHLVAGEALRPRILPLIIVLLCIASFFADPMKTSTELHVILRVYRAGGPRRFNDWAQGLIQRYPGYGDLVNNQSPEKVPPEIRQQLNERMELSGRLCVYGDRERIPPVLRIEMGGGFFHYGILVVSSASAPQSTWWQRRLSWPAEVIIYQDDD